jgi:hypothetical protein
MKNLLMIWYGLLFSISLPLNAITWPFFGFDLSGYIVDKSSKRLEKYDNE